LGGWSNDLVERHTSSKKPGRIAYDQMTGIDVKEFGTKGIVRLQYRDAPGQAATAVLDEEKIARLEEIVAGWCEKKN
jgi:hypothetical protein